MIHTMRSLCSVSPSNRGPVGRILDKCHRGSPELLRPHSITVDERKMASLVLEAERDESLLSEVEEGLFRRVIDVERLKENFKRSRGTGEVKEQGLEDTGYGTESDEEG